METTVSQYGYRRSATVPVTSITVGRPTTTFGGADTCSAKPLARAADADAASATATRASTAVCRARWMPYELYMRIFSLCLAWSCADGECAAPLTDRLRARVRAA